MARPAIDEPLLRLQLEVLHLGELIVDHPMHRGHLAGGSLWSLVVAREVLYDVAVRARDAQSVAVSEIHDHEQSARGHGLQPWELHVLENLFGRLVLSARLEEHTSELQS